MSMFMRVFSVLGAAGACTWIFDIAYKNELTTVGRIGVCLMLAVTALRWAVEGLTGESE